MISKQTGADGEFSCTEFIRRHLLVIVDVRRQSERHLAANFTGRKLHQQQQVVTAASRF